MQKFYFTNKNYYTSISTHLSDVWRYFLTIAFFALFGGVTSAQVNKQLYLSDPSQALDRVHPGLVSPIDNTTATSGVMGALVCLPKDTFTTSTNLTNQWGGQSSLTPSIAVYRSPAGVETEHVVFVGKATGALFRNVYYTVRTGTGVWSTPLLLSNDTWGNDVQSYTSIAVDANNKAYVVYAQKNGATDASINVYYVTNVSGSWSTPLRLSDDVGVLDATTPEIALDGNNKAYIVYVDKSGADTKRNVYYMTNLSGSWSAPARISNDAFGNDVLENPSIAVDASNKAHVAYVHKNGAGDFGINAYYVTNSSGSWSAPVRISNDSFFNDVQNNPSIALDANGKAHVAYAHRNVLSDAQINTYYVNNLTGSWSTPVKLSNDNNNKASQNPAIAVSCTGIVRVAFSNGTTSIYYTENSGAGNSWTPLLLINGPPAKTFFGDNPGIALTKYNLHLVFQDRPLVGGNAVDIFYTSTRIGVPNANPSIAFTQAANCGNIVIPSGGTVTATIYANVTGGTMPASPNITLTLAESPGSTFLTLTNPTYNSGTGLLTWTGTTPSVKTIVAGNAMVLTVATAIEGVTFTLQYDSDIKPSKVEFPTSTYIGINSYAVYSAPYPGGSIITNAIPGTTVYPRAVVTDPFGFSDIRGMNITLTPPGSTVAATSVATSGCTRTYEYAWTTSGTGTVSIPATAQEGYEGTVTAVQALTFDVCTPIGTPVFTSPAGATSSRAQGAGSVTYTATSTNATGITYSLDVSSLSAGNTIVAATGVVTYTAGWAGTSVITATATGCAGPTTATHTVTITVYKQLYLSDPSQALDRIDPVATSDATTSSTNLLGYSPTVNIDATTTDFSANPGSTTFSVSHTTGTGSNRLMLVGISQKNKAVTGVTYDGTPLSLVGEVLTNSNAKVHLYSLLNPPSGTANVVVSLNANPDKGIVVGVTTFTEVHQSSPLGTFNGAQNSSSTPSVNISSAVGELVFDVISVRSSSSLTVGSGQTQRWNTNTGSEIWGGGSTKSGAGTTTMSWTPSGSVDWAIGGVSIQPAEVTNVTFTESAALCSALAIKSGQTITVTNYISVSSGTMPANPNITALLKYGSTTIITLTNPTYNSGTGLLTWTGTLGADVTVPAGQAIALQITTAQSGVTFRIDYDSQTKPSKISLPVSTYIGITSYDVYSAPYPGGSIITNTSVGTVVYPRAVVTDPFGFSDITAMNITRTPPGSTVAATSVATSGCTRTYEYVWNTAALSGTYSIPATAKEGYENTVTAVKNLSFDVCSPLIGTPIFTLGATSTRCQGANSVTYTATSTNSTGITYSLDATSISGGNSIVAATGVVTYAAGWSGTSTITATATGCGGPTTASHTVTITPSVGTPVFTLGTTSTRCIGAGTVTYSASATNTTGITYTLDDVSSTAGNTINPSTGTVTYTATWAGTSTITASAAGCNGPTTATHTVITVVIDAVNDIGIGSQGEPIVVNVLTNDLCNINSSSVAIITQPQNGSLQIGTGGVITYLPNGNFSGSDQYSYRVCSSIFPAICDTAIVTLTITPNYNDPCVEAPQSKTYYLPFPENATQVRKALWSAASISNLTNNVRTVVSMKISYPNTIITYDHWEDGYESNITAPIQSTTRVWGDGNLTNGIAPGYPSDIIPAGGYIILDNQFSYNPRVATDIVFDGKDKIYTTTDVAVSKYVGDVTIVNLQSLKTNVLDITRFGKYFVVPFGEDITLGSTSAFKYTGAFIRASTNGTTVSLDYNGDNVIDLTQTLNEGEVWFYDGTASTPGVAGNTNNANDIKAGAKITSNFPVGVDLVFGGIDSYGTRNIALLPGAFFGNSYYNPVFTSLATAPVYVFLTNTLSSAITVNWNSGTGGSGSIVVPANSTNYLNLPLASTGYKFVSAGGESFSAVAVVDADASGSSYDWAFNLVPTDRLTSFTSVAWAPGSNDLTQNYNPIWVTPTANTTLYIKYNGNLGTITPTMSPCNVPYDIAVPLTALQSYQIYDNSDNDQTGTAIYTCDGTTFSAAWGQDAFANGLTTPTGGGISMDVGYTLTPRCLRQLILANDDRDVTEPATPVKIGILSNDVGFLCSLNSASLSTTGLLQPSNGTIVINADHTITYTPNSGFTGIDVFEYQVCAVEYPLVCDIARVTITVSDCVALPTENLVTGKVYIEKLPYNGAYNVSELFAANVQVDLYTDKNCNQVVDVGEGIAQTTYSNLSGYYSFSTQNGYNAKDDFEPTPSFIGNDGGINWTSSWVEQGDNGIINSGDVRIIPDASSGGFGNAIRLGGPNNGISRSLTFNTALSATLKFMYRRQNLQNIGEQLLVQVNGVTIYTINDGDLVGTDINYTEVTLNLPSFNANSSNTVQFITNGTPATTSYFWIDYVELIYFSTPTCYIAKVNPANTGGNFTAASLNTQPASFTSLGVCDKDNYLGLIPSLVAVDDAVNTSTDLPITISVLSNDVPGQPDTATVTTTGLVQPSNGTTTVNPSGTITYTPDPGFNGTDQFEYRVCSLNDPNVCDIALVTVTISCLTIPLQNTVTGIVYYDKNLDGSQQAGETGRPSVGVNLYLDSNNNSLLDTGEPLVATTTTSGLGTYQFNVTPPSTTNTYLDQFNANTTANQTNGTVSWASNFWTEIGEADGFAAGDLRITTTNGLQVQTVANTAKGVYRTANINSAISATLSFKYTESGLDLDINDYVDVMVATSAAPTSWTLLKRLTGADGNQSGTLSYDITSYISATTTIRFLTANSASMIAGDIVYFDDVKISYNTPNAAKYTIQLVQPLPTGYTLTTPTPSPTGIQTASFAAAGAGDCQNNFGLAGADLIITKTDSPDPVASGANVTYTITVRNNGPTNATGVSVADVLPAGLTLVSATPSVGSWSAPNWTIGALTSGVTVSMVLVAIVSVTTPAATIISNTATVTSTTSDPNSANNTSTATTTVICPTLTVTPGSNSPVCQGNTLNLTETGGSAVSWSWSGPSGFTSTAQNPTISGIALARAGTYSVTITSINGCTASASTAVVVNALPTVSIAETDASCTANDGKVQSAAAATLTATAGFTSYAWDNSLGTGNPKTVNPVATTTYSVTATDANGCTATASSTVTVIATPTVTIAETDASCTANDGKVQSAAAATLTATAGFSSYAWDNSLGTGNPKTVNPVATTTYSVTATDANGCTATASSTVTVIATPTVTIAETDASCTANDGKVQSAAAATLTATAGFTSYAWDNALGTGNPKVVNPVATTTYSVTATDANGCTATASNTVTVIATPSVTIAETDASCTANDGKVQSAAAATLTATAGFASYVWDNSLGTGSPQTVNPVSTTTYSVTATDANGCTATASSTVTVIATPSVTIAETDASCTANDGKVLSGAAATLTATAGFSSYAWDNALGTGTPKTVNPTATTTYSVTATDANGCTATASSTVTVISAPPALTIAETDASCTANDGKVQSAAAATLTATAGFASYVWDNSLGTGSPQTVNPVSTTTYSVTATDANGCTATASSTVTIVALPDFTLAQAAICPDETDYAIISNLTNAVAATSQVKVNTGVYFTYPSPSNITPTNGLVSGNNTITVKNSAGCETAKNINIIPTPSNSCIPLTVEKSN